MLPHLEGVFTKACARPAELTVEDLTVLARDGGNLYQWAVLQYAKAIAPETKAAPARAAASTAATAPPARQGLAPEALAEIVVGTIKKALETPGSRIAALESELQRVKDELLEVRAQLAAQRDLVEP